MRCGQLLRAVFTSLTVVRLLVDEQVQPLDAHLEEGFHLVMADEIDIDMHANNGQM